MKRFIYGMVWLYLHLLAVQGLSFLSEPGRFLHVPILGGIFMAGLVILLDGD